MSYVDWTDYAREYDLLMAQSPPYQDLIAHCKSTFASLRMPPGSIIADLGGGTGNFSIELALQHPDQSILHVERDAGMLEVATRKAATAGVHNWFPIKADIEKTLNSLPTLYAAVCVNVIYTCQNPRTFVDHVAEKLNSGGIFYACDLGRRMHVLDWALYIISQSLINRGVLETLRLIRSTRRVREQNRIIAALQDNGQFWLHNLPEFTHLFEEAGLQILTSTSHMYRGYNDTVISRHP